MSDLTLTVALSEEERTFLLIACGVAPEGGNRGRPGASELTGEGVLALRRRLEAARPGRAHPSQFAPSWADLHHGGSPAADVVAVLLAPPDYRFDRALPGPVFGRLTADLDEDAGACGACRVAFITGDLLATDIELGECHAACLEGAPVVDLETGEPTGGTAKTWRYQPEPSRPEVAA